MTPLTPAELRATIYVRIGEAAECCNTPRRDRFFARIEGLLFALTGEEHRVHLDTFVGDTLTAAGIPWTKDGEFLSTPDEWMKEHGFEQKRDGSYGNRHPRFGGT